jgi:DNA-binding IclR family transcriptional regulator
LLNLAAPSPRSVVGRLTAILLTFRCGGPRSVTELAQLVGLPVSTTHRLVGELARWQLLRRRPDGLYEVGSNLQRLAGDAASVPTLDDRAPLAVTDLFEATHRRTRLGVLCDGRVLYVERRTLEAPPTQFSADATLPAHATALGKALLAFAPREAVALVSRNLAAYTSQTLTRPEHLHRELQLARLVGIAVGREELAPGDSAIAAPVFGAGGRVIAALEVQVRELRDDVRMFRPALVVAASSLSRELSLLGSRDERPSWGARPLLQLMSVPHRARLAASLGETAFQFEIGAPGREPASS